MKALLLAAGYGTRLRPLSELLPKCLMPVQGKILMDYWFCQLDLAGVSSYIVNTHYMASTIDAYLARHPQRERITVSHEEALLNTGGTLLDNRKLLDNDAFMLVHADNLCVCDFRAFIHAHDSRPDGTVMTMMTFDAHNPSECGVLGIDHHGVVQSFHEKVEDPPGCLANGAVYIIEPELFDYLEKIGKREIDFSREVIPAFMGRINTYHNSVYHRDIGTVHSLLQAQVDDLGDGLCVVPNGRWPDMNYDQLCQRIKDVADVLMQGERP